MRGGLITIGEAAKLCGIPRMTILRRLKAANETSPGLLVHFTRADAKPRGKTGARVYRWFVRLARLKKLIEGED